LIEKPLTHLGKLPRPKALNCRHLLNRSASCERFSVGGDHHTAKKTRQPDFLEMLAELVEESLC
jgi:hypothetical protein